MVTTCVLTTPITREPEKHFIRIGKVVYDYYQKSFEGFELEKFKEEIKEAMSPKKRGRKKVGE